MKLAYDLHIHSGLSPCGEEDMTPNNVIAMAKLKGLDVIAITDHNSTGNLISFHKVAETNSLLFIPGVELTTREEVHVLGLFRNIADALDFQKVIDGALPRIKNQEQLFGRQIYYDEMDNIVGYHEYLLLNSLKLSLDNTVKAIREHGGIPIPAHINREAYSILASLGFIPPNLGFQTVEITKKCDYNQLESQHPYLKTYGRIINSDAHQLGNILERESYIEVEKKTVDDIITALDNGHNLINKKQ